MADEATGPVWGAFIDGETVPTAATYDVVDPGTGCIAAEVARSGAGELDQALSSARQAQQPWSRLAVSERADVLVRCAEVIRDQSNRAMLAELEMRDTGKPISQANADVDVTARYFTFYARAVEAYQGASIPISSQHVAYTENLPFGTIGSILAWNYPLQLLARSVAPALATGNAIVTKPADETPRSALALARLLHEQAGLPAGLFNVLPGVGAEIGGELSRSPEVDRLAFVGSVATGMRIAKAASANVVPLTLELGGKSAHIVLPSADIDRAVPVISTSILQNAGQTCSAGSRLIVHESLVDQTVEALISRFQRVRIGHGESDPDLGPLISDVQRDRVQAMVDRAPSGAVVYGGKQVAVSGSQGYFFEPTVVRTADDRCEIAQEEVFGPVITVIAYADEQEAVRIANGTAYGLLAAVWARDIDDAFRVSRDLRVGQVYINGYGVAGGVELPFGGYGKSGYGREKGIEGLREFTSPRVTTVTITQSQPA